MTFGPTDSASIVSQTAAKVAGDIYAAEVAAGIDVDFAATHQVVTESILAQAKVALASEFFNVPEVERTPPVQSQRTSASGRPVPQRPQQAQRQASRPSGGGGQQRRGSGGKPQFEEWTAPSGITVVSPADQAFPLTAEGEYDGLDALPDADCYSCGNDKVWDNRADHAHFGGSGNEARPYFKCTNKDCTDKGGSGFWPPRDN
jgi:hypothetical protein